MHGLSPLSSTPAHTHICSNRAVKPQFGEYLVQESRNQGHKSYLHSRVHLWKQIPSEQKCCSGAPEAEMWDLTGTCVGSTSNPSHQHPSAEDSDQALLIQCVGSSLIQHELENFPCVPCWSSPRAEYMILLQIQVSLCSTLQHSAFKFFDTLWFFVPVTTNRVRHIWDMEGS